MAAERRRTESLGLDPDKIPAHIAIIMDGNGRWAQRRMLPRSMGHRAGMQALEEIVRACDELGVRIITVYAFSTENWKRPLGETTLLMQLLLEYMKLKLKELHEQQVQIHILGDTAGLPTEVQRSVRQAEALTAHNSGLVFNIALNYGARHEILQACRSIALAVEQGELVAAELTEQDIAERLYTAGMADPDLLIRTGGEMRVSNYLLWQIAYAELMVTATLWPDFDRAALIEAIREYQQRDRRFGGLSGIR